MGVSLEEAEAKSKVGCQGLGSERLLHLTDLCPYFDAFSVKAGFLAKVPTTLGGMWTTSNKRMDLDSLAQMGLVVIFPASVGNAFSMNTSNMDQYMPNLTVFSHLVKLSLIW